MRKLYCDILEWNYNHGKRIPIKNIALGLANWMRKHESDYNGKWENLDLETDLNRNLYWFLNETGLKISHLRGIVKNRINKKELYEQLEKLNIQVKERYGKIHLYDLNIYGDEIIEKEKSVISNFIYYVKRNVRMRIDTFQPVVSIANEYSRKEVEMGVSKTELSDLLHKYEDDIRKAGISITTGEYPEIKIYTYTKG